MNRFYMPVHLQVGETAALTDTVFHHWIRVLRAELNHRAILFNGEGGEYEVFLNQIDKKTATIMVDQFNPLDRDAPCTVLLGQVMSKGDRMDYAIQKATELGVHQIQLLTSERCEMRLKYERDQKKIEHWQSIAIAACEQCGLNRVPEILAPLPLHEWLQSDLPTSRLVLAPDLNGEDVLHKLSPDVAILIGPEGGLSAAEIRLAQHADFKPWCIGERVLRTETAPVVALSILNYTFSKSQKH